MQFITFVSSMATPKLFKDLLHASYQPNLTTYLYTPKLPRSLCVRQYGTFYVINWHPLTVTTAPTLANELNKFYKYFFKVLLF